MKVGSLGKRAVLSTLSGDAKAQATIGYRELFITYGRFDFKKKSDNYLFETY
ncbi:hypothetical protein [Flexistipes sp.]|uniref:hypothetical protein n=1 Tax=Flexistipes sp. TaxID=3088135 RepID=UPI002E1F9C63|nr:hypothetical protein [Flexistipes sp.]